ncbi:MAG: ATP-binding protein [[Clostridium] innocuum]
MKESKTLEFKESITKSFLKTVSAFSNYDGGEIIFGIDDDGNIKGLSDPKSTCLDIENRINDNIVPLPGYSLKIDETNKIISLVIKEGKKINFEDLPSSNQKMDFHYLENKLKEHIDIKIFNQDTLKTLNLYNVQIGYNNAANILSDNNSFPGIDIAKFGDSINIIKKRLLLENMSVLEMYDVAVQTYRDYYQYEEIEGSYRKKVDLVPEEAFRESVANALIHRAWDLNANIRISMYDDRIEITSPGGLINGITKDEYITGMISMLRNPIISNIFYRLGIVEIFGTGILRILHAYEESIKKPIFNVSTNTIQIILPVFDSNPVLQKDEEHLYAVLSKTKPMSISEILPHVTFSRSKVKELLKKMEKDGIVKIKGRGKGTKYYL